MHSLSQQKNSLAIRIWHWTIVLVFFASITTVLLGSTLFKTKQNISVVAENVARKGGHVTSDQARMVAHAFSDKIWNLHTLIGYGLCFLLAGRILIELTQKRNEKLHFRIREALNWHPVSKESIAERNRFILVKRGYLIFYFLFLSMALTGGIMAFEEVEFLKPLQNSARSFHQFIQYGIYAYILLHITGVVRADLNKNKGIVSGMIHGGDSR